MFFLALFLSRWISLSLSLYLSLSSFLPLSFITHTNIRTYTNEHTHTHTHTHTNTHTNMGRIQGGAVSGAVQVTLLKMHVCMMRAHERERKRERDSAEITEMIYIGFSNISSHDATMGGRTRCFWRLCSICLSSC